MFVKGLVPVSPLLKSAALLGSLVAAPAIAHHGWSSYDASKTIRVTAPLSDVTWGNPHGTARGGLATARRGTSSWRRPRGWKRAG